MTDGQTKLKILRCDKSEHNNTAQGPRGLSEAETDRCCAAVLVREHKEIYEAEKPTRSCCNAADKKKSHQPDFPFQTARCVAASSGNSRTLEHQPRCGRSEVVFVEAKQTLLCKQSQANRDAGRWRELIWMETNGRTKSPNLQENHRTCMHAYLRECHCLLRQLNNNSVCARLCKHTQPTAGKPCTHSGEIKRCEGTPPPRHPSPH